MESHHKRERVGRVENTNERKERKKRSINIVLSFPASSILPISAAGLIGLGIRLKVHRHQMYRYNIGISKNSPEENLDFLYLSRKIRAQATCFIPPGR
jgi:hypothetical protein